MTQTVQWRTLISEPDNQETYVYRLGYLLPCRACTLVRKFWQPDGDVFFFSSGMVVLELLDSLLDEGLCAVEERAAPIPDMLPRLY